MPISEIVDRLSIALLKQQRTDNDMSEEISVYRSNLEAYPESEEFLSLLFSVNGKIWDLESDIRRGNEKLLGLEEIGRRALNIRELNKERVSYKNALVKLYGEGFEDIKMNHGSS